MGGYSSWDLNVRSRALSRTEPLLNQIPLFTIADLEGWFGKSTVEKGRGLVSAVLDLHLSMNRVEGHVQGTRKQPYSVIFSWDKRGPSGYCSCPVAFMCKHAAALLLKTFSRRDTLGDLRKERLLDWIDAVKRSSDAPAIPPRSPSSGRSILVWGLSFDSRSLRAGVRAYKARLGSRGGISKNLIPWNNFDRALTTPADFCDDTDRKIIWHLRRGNPSRGLYNDTWSLAGPDGEAALTLLFETGRFIADTPTMRPVLRGDPRPGSIVWLPDGPENQRPACVTTPDSDMLLIAGSLWYVDLEEGSVGPVVSDLVPAVLEKILEAPALTPEELGIAETLLKDLLPPSVRTAFRPPPPAKIDQSPVPVLRLSTLRTRSIRAHREYPYSWHPRLFDGASLLFRYGDHLLSLTETRGYVLQDGRPLLVTRRPKEEKEFLARLGRLGLSTVLPGVLEVDPPAQVPEGFMGLSSEGYWSAFMEQIPLLKKEGWEIDIPDDFRHQCLPVDSFDATVSGGGSDWLSLHLGITVAGKTVSLVPLLSELFSRDSRWLSPSHLKTIPDDEPVELKTSEGRVRLTADRLKIVVGTLIDLFDEHPLDGQDRAIRLSRFDAFRVEALSGKNGWSLTGGDSLREIGRILATLLTPSPLSPPESFQGTLRPYQREGLGWMQSLRSHGLSGVLADDMGLGKTAQALAHISLEKHEGRLDRPALVVVPTSLIFNWMSETRRFTPDLSVVSLQGKDRKDRFDAIDRTDVVLTTYPLLWRDADFLKKQEFHMLVLDEAQVVKNADSHAARIVRELSSRHRLCLTGTPLENHLGELWSLFDFLMPGFLGTSKNFTRSFRTPIEKQGDDRRREILSKRLRPFVLRRKKEEVAAELPPKTLVVRKIELAGAQRDLYETVRSAMDRKIREEISDKGFSRSRIVILDALLKLRQVCCDPRLLKSGTARTVTESAKLGVLLEMLAELLEEGRRILLFSQFTGMLDLIIPELSKRGLSWVELRGSTVDRSTPVQRFQKGEVPLFLISLKAGGVGLNLTGADVVIHYDPWWNPAVENQATDRAHRIGQTKPVFVYKLIAAGSIEERILGLQEKKAELAAGILNPETAENVRFTEEDLRELFSPLADDR